MRKLLAVLSACVLASCASAAMPSGRDGLARQIADDAAAFNEAYAQAVSAQILLNILRSRDRLPRQYLSMTGISDSPSLRLRQNLGIGGVPLGEGASPWGIGSVGLERETQSRPSYEIQPFAANTLTRAAFQPTEPYVFSHYWRSGWPRDILLLVMVERIEKTGANRERTEYVNEANEIFNDCAESVRTRGCDFVREARGLLASVNAAPAESGVDARRGRPLCGLVQALAPSAPVRVIEPAEGVDCDPVFVVGGSTLRLRLRSLDDMVYYVGELMRAGAMNAEAGAAIEAQVNVRAAGLRGGGRGVPLFRIVPAGAENAALYAAEVNYGGRRYAAGPAIGRSCADATDAGACVDNAEQGDRSSSVVSLIAELMALNQSPDAVRAPNRLFAN